MRLDTRAFAFAGSVAAALLFVICALGVAVAPQATTAFAGELFHIDMSGLARTLTWGSFVMGLVCWTAGTALTFALIAATYNRMVGSQP